MNPEVILDRSTGIRTEVVAFSEKEKASKESNDECCGNGHCRCNKSEPGMFINLGQ